MLFFLYIVFELDLKQWTSLQNDDCWYTCGNKGGSCDFCKSGSQKGFCCRKDGEGGNGDCPTSAIQIMPNTHHICMIENAGNYLAFIDSNKKTSN